MKHIAICLGFRNPNALKIFKNGVDHHRKHQVPDSMLTALMKELLVPYTRSCLLTADPPSKPALMDILLDTTGVSRARNMLIFII